MTLERGLFFANRRGRRLFAMLTEPTGRRSSRSGIILCYPIGEDLLTSYRAYARLARRLAAEGIPALRFHYSGFGDSEGSTADATLASMLDDAEDAVAWLGNEAAIEAVGVMGFRFGALVAGLLAERCPGIRALCLHSPVVSGAGYCEQLLKTRQVADIARSRKAPSRRELLRTLASTGSLDIGAERYGNGLFQSLLDTDLTRHLPARRSRCMLAPAPAGRRTHDATQALEDAYRAAGCDVTVWTEPAGGLRRKTPLIDTAVSDAFVAANTSWFGGEA